MYVFDLYFFAMNLHVHAVPFFLAGFIHDTHTITSALTNAVSVSGDLTSEFCWFPGYMYQYVYCTACNRQLGWKYFSRNLMPRSFLGLSGNSIYFDNVSNLQSDSATNIDADSSADEFEAFVLDF